MELSLGAVCMMESLILLNPFHSQPNKTDINLENDLLEGVMNAQREFNIRTTPSFIVNGILYSGSKDIKEFRQIIDKILSQ
mgnify:CR=1 FL=1